MARRGDEVAAWLRQKPSLAQVRAGYPAEWRAVQHDIARMVTDGDPEKITAYLTEAARPRRATPGRARPAREVASAAVRQYLTVALLNQAYLAASTGVRQGPVRFTRVNGRLAQRLLFRRGLERKPVSMAWFRLVWPLLGQRRLLMPLVRPHGIYCFYSGRLIRALADLIGDRSCLEIGAGDGTLSRFLAAAGVDVTATDDHSWRDAVTYPDDVHRQDAVSALRTRRPEVVICSWPPPGNTFERQVFITASVQLYIVIGSAHEAAAGNWQAYRTQSGFEWTTDERLSSWVLPPENRGAVHLFRRTTGAS